MAEKRPGKVVELANPTLDRRVKGRKASVKPSAGTTARKLKGTAPKVASYKKKMNYLASYSSYVCDTMTLMGCRH